VRVATWNVLHRFHAQNWDEPAIETHPDETARIAAITARVEGLDHDGVICLQEVSGDQLGWLRKALADDAVIYTHKYPRVPKLFRPGFGPAPLADPTEHLVTIVRGLGTARRSEGHTFPDDKGKGFLLVELASGVVVINTHVSYGDHHVSQCAQLGTYATTYRGPLVIAGDFNEEREICGSRLGPGFVAAIPAEPARPTRPRTKPSSKSETIDHIFVVRTNAYEVEVLAGGGLSDHNPVIATVR
jgi:endonuclease/exonuclease/phosphatase family metal-dependent hydrolase